MGAKKITLGILAHVDAGKTTLAEALLFLTGEIKKPGRVDHGDAFMDDDPIERNRGITIFSRQARFTVKGAGNADTEVTLIDTPGHVDFAAEMETVVRQDITMEEFLDSSDVAVESARHDQLKGVWVIGIGFVRPWGRIKSTASILSGHPEGVAIRTVKTVTISDETGEVLDYE